MTQEEKLANILHRNGITLHRIYQGETVIFNNVVSDRFLLRFEVRGERFWETTYFSGIGNRVLKIPSSRKKVKTFVEYPRKQGEKVTHLLLPSLQELLECLVSDTNAGEELFHDFCENYGYETDSRTHLELYLKCQEAAYHMRRMFRGSYNELIQTLEEE